MWIGDVPFKDLGMTKEKMDLLKELAEDDEYWERSNMFVRSITNRKLLSLSTNQRRWLEGIILALDEELARKSWRP